jgi:hypothetical protein
MIFFYDSKQCKPNKNICKNPQIKRSQFKGKSIYYLEDKNKRALLEMMKQNTTRIISYQDLARASQVFNTDIEIYEKRSFLGKID